MELSNFEENISSEAQSNTVSENNSPAEAAKPDAIKENSELTEIAFDAIRKRIPGPWFDTALDLGFSREELVYVYTWAQTLGSASTRKMYVKNLIAVCSYYHKSLFKIFPREWIDYANHVLPEELAKGSSRASVRSSFYAVTSFLHFYGKEEPWASGILYDMVVPTQNKPVNVDGFPTASDMAAILAESRKTNLAVYTAVLLAYECALQPSEILHMKAGDFYTHTDKSTGECTYRLYVPFTRGQKRRTIMIHKDVYMDLCAASDYSMSQGGTSLIVNRGGEPISKWALYGQLRTICDRLISKGKLKSPVTLMSIRGAAINRFLMSDGASITTAARYTGVSESYVYSVRQSASASAVDFPGTRKGYDLHDLLSAGEAESKNIGTAKEE